MVTPEMKWQINLKIIASEKYKNTFPILTFLTPFSSSFALANELIPSRVKAKIKSNKIQIIYAPAPFMYEK